MIDGQDAFIYEESPNMIAPRWTYRSGSHYIFAEDWQDFKAQKWAPNGYLCIGGGIESKDQIMRAVNTQVPAILMMHTSGVTQEVAQILELLKERKQAPAEISDEVAAGRIHQIIQKTAVADEKFDGKLIYIEDIINFSDISKSQPRLLEDIIISVNPMTDSPDYVLGKLSACFAVASTAVSETGAGLADKHIVRVAWTLHQRLVSASLQQQARSNAFLGWGLVLSFLATLASILVSFLENHEIPAIAAWQQSRWWRMADYSVVVLPALSSVVSTMAFNMNSNSKSAALECAAGELVHEIYRFRMRVGPYDITAAGKKSSSETVVSKTSDTPNETTEDANMSTRANCSRQRFSTKIQQVYCAVQMGEMADDVIKLMPEESAGSLVMDLAEITKHVEQHFYPVQKPSQRHPGQGRKDRLRREIAPERPDETICDALLESGDRSEEGVDESADDFLGQLSMHSYIKHRVEPSITSSAKQAQRLSYSVSAVNVALLVSGTLATLLAATGLKEWVPLAVALTASLTAVSQHFRLKPRLMGMNETVAALQGCITLWNSLGIVDRRMPSTRKQIVSATEAALLSALHAKTGTVGTIGQPPDVADGQKEQKGQKGQKSQAKH